MAEELSSASEKPRRRVPRWAGLLLLLTFLGAFGWWWQPRELGVVARIPLANLARGDKFSVFSTDAGVVARECEGRYSLFDWKTGRKVWTITCMEHAYDYYPDTPVFWISPNGRYAGAFVRSQRNPSIFCLWDRGRRTWVHTTLTAPIANDALSILDTGEVLIVDTPGPLLRIRLLRKGTLVAHAEQPMAKHDFFVLSPDQQYLGISNGWKTSVYRLDLRVPKIVLTPQASISHSLHSERGPPSLLNGGLLVTTDHRVFDRHGRCLTTLSSPLRFGSAARAGTAVCLHDSPPSIYSYDDRVGIDTCRIISPSGAAGWHFPANTDEGWSRVSPGGQYALVASIVPHRKSLPFDLEYRLPALRVWYAEHPSARLRIYERPGRVCAVLPMRARKRLAQSYAEDVFVVVRGMRYTPDLLDFAPRGRRLYLVGQRGGFTGSWECVLLKW